MNDLNDVLALFLIYCPLAVAGYYCYGDAAESSIVNTMSHGPLRITAEVCFLIHLIAAFPIVFNPGAQYFEELMNIPKLCFFRKKIPLLCFMKRLIQKTDSQF